jgi:hypothetical protein
VWWAAWRRAEASTRLDPLTLREIVLLLPLPLLPPIPLDTPRLSDDDDDEASDAIVYSSTRLAPSRRHWFVLTVTDKQKAYTSTKPMGRAARHWILVVPALGLNFLYIWASTCHVHL